MLVVHHVTARHQYRLRRDVIVVIVPQQDGDRALAAAREGVDVGTIPDEGGRYPQGLGRPYPGLPPGRGPRCAVIPPLRA